MAGAPMSLAWRFAAVTAAGCAVGAAIGGAVAASGRPWTGVVIALVPAVFAGVWFAARVGRALGETGDALAKIARGQEPGAIPAIPGVEGARVADAVAGVQGRIEEMAARAVTLAREQEAVMESVDGGVLALDREQRILNLNRAAERMLGISGAQARGALLQDVTRYASLNSFVAEAIDNPGISDEFQLESPLSGGGRIGFSVRASSRPLHDSEQRVVGVFVFLLDVTRLKRLEAVRTDFAANVSHELRTPITNIRGYIETLLETPLTDPVRTTEFLRIAQRNATRLHEIVDDMLALTNLERPDTPETLATAPVRASAIVEAALQELEMERAAREIRFRVEGDPALVLMVNRGLAVQALGNLLSNAVRHSPPESEVVVRVERCELPDASAGVELAVIDHGVGIASEHIPRVFERFYRADRARSREQGGTGLGLSIVKHIALAHGGKALVESVAGRGSTFRLRLPAAG